MKDAARLLAYLAGTVLLGALLSPLLFKTVQALSAHQQFAFLAKYGFETVFHRALLLAAIVLLYPLLALCGIRGVADLDLVVGRPRMREIGLGFAVAALPLFCFSLGILLTGVYTVRASFQWNNIAAVTLAAVVVPVLEEFIFRGLFLGILLRSNPATVAVLTTSAIFSVVHFLKAPDDAMPAAAVHWNSGLKSVANSFAQFANFPLVLAAFTTLFLLGWILADARVKTRALWVPIGLHSGWIFVSGVFNKIAHRELLILPWLGKSLLVGIAPLTVALVSWAILRSWLKHAGDRHT